MNVSSEEKLFAVQAFKAEGYALVPQEPQRCDTEREARNLAAKLFKNYPAVVAWVMDRGSDPRSAGIPEVLLKIGRVPDKIDLAIPDQQAVPDLTEQLQAAAERPEVFSRAEMTALLRKAAAEIDKLRRRIAGGAG